MDLRKQLDRIEKEIDERLSDTINRENKALVKQYEDLPFFQRQNYPI